MSESIEAIFTNGVFRPEQPVHLAEGERVSLTVATKTSALDDLADIQDLLDADVLESCRRADQAAPTVSDARKILSRFEGSLADRILADRDES